MKEKNNNHQYIEKFYPDISVLNTDCRDFLFSFNAGTGNENFNEFLQSEAEEYRLNGNGVTYVIWNTLYNDDMQITKEIVGYFTLSSNAIPYIDRIRLDENEIVENGDEFDEENWGIPVLEIKMFAVNDKYQDVFYNYEEEELPIAAWCLFAIINYAKLLLDSVLGFKALFLHSVPQAESFYLKNGFRDMKINMQPFASVDSDMRPMWLPLKNVHMNYEK